MEASNQVSGRDLHDLGFLFSALLCRKRTARVITAALWHVVRRGNHALYRRKRLVRLLLREFGD